MATSGNHDENETETTIDVSGFMRAFVKDDDDENTGDKADRSGDISMFCKACLHPYSGEQKSGTIVLRCERCGQTDTVLEESVSSLNPQEWIGNLMMNRFISVVKEQEDLSANLSDPHFAEDDYKKISLFLSEYTYSIEKIVVHLYDIAEKANMASEEDKKRIDSCAKEDASVIGLEEVQAMNATKTLLEIHKTLIMNDPRQKFVNNVSENDEQETGTQKTSPSHQQLDESLNEKECKNSVEEDRHTNKETLCDDLQEMNGNQKIESEVSDGRENEIEEKIQIVRNTLDRLGATVSSLIDNLSLKYEISDDVMISVQRILLNLDTEETSDTDEHSENDQETVDATEDSKDSSNNEKEVEDIAGNNGDSDAKDENPDAENKSEKSRTIFNVSTETIRQEVYDALGHKLKLSFGNKPCATRKIDWDQTADSILEISSNGESTNGVDSPTLKSSQSIEDDVDTNTDVIPENKREEKVAECVENDKESCNTNTEGATDTFQVNFYSLACEFIRELQRRKNKALGERKNKALLNVHEKIDRLKLEMEKVEEVVTAELALAYKRKMKKVEKQKKQLDEKHSQVKEAERLLEYYTMTGQEDKVAELAEQFNIQYEN